MDPYAVIESGGKQYRVKNGDTVTVERLPVDVSQEIRFERVLALSDGKSLNVGTPSVDGASVYAKVVEHIRAPKVVAFKKKRRKDYRRKAGHRQNLTVLRINDIRASGDKATAQKTETKKAAAEKPAAKKPAAKKTEGKAKPAMKKAQAKKPAAKETPKKEK